MTNVVTNKKWLMVGGVVAALLLFFLSADWTHAAFNEIKVNGESVSSSNDTDKFFAEANALMYVVLALAGMFTLGCVIYGGAKLAASGGNAQSRTGDMIFLAFALLGAFIVYKSLEILGWVSGLGT